jgi:hypothetical protein
MMRSASSASSSWEEGGGGAGCGVRGAGGGRGSGSGRGRNKGARLGPGASPRRRSSHPPTQAKRPPPLSPPPTPHRAARDDVAHVRVLQAVRHAAQRARRDVRCVAAEALGAEADLGGGRAGRGGTGGPGRAAWRAATAAWKAGPPPCARASGPRARPRPHLLDRRARRQQRRQHLLGAVGVQEVARAKQVVLLGGMGRVAGSKAFVSSVFVGSQLAVPACLGPVVAAAALAAPATSTGPRGTPARPHLAAGGRLGHGLGRRAAALDSLNHQLRQLAAGGSAVAGIDMREGSIATSEQQLRPAARAPPPAQPTRPHPLPQPPALRLTGCSPT